MKLSDKEENSSHRALIFGPPKAGKTCLAGSLANEFDLIVFDLENGSSSLRSLPAYLHSKIEVVSLPDTRSYPIAIETMLKVIKGSSVEICETHGKVSCAVCKKSSAPVILLELNTLPASTVVIVDSLTQLTNSAISYITKGKPDDYNSTSG